MDTIDVFKMMKGKKLSKRQIEESINGEKRKIDDYKLPLYSCGIIRLRQPVGRFDNLYREDGKIIREIGTYKYKRSRDPLFSGFYLKKYIKREYNEEGLLTREKIVTWTFEPWMDKKVEVSHYDLSGEFNPTTSYAY